MKRGGQLTLSLGGTMRLVPTSRSPLAVPAATGQPDAEGPMEQAAKRAAQVFNRTFKASARAWLRDSFICCVRTFYWSRGRDKTPARVA